MPVAKPFSVTIIISIVVNAGITTIFRLLCLACTPLILNPLITIRVLKLPFLVTLSMALLGLIIHLLEDGDLFFHHIDGEELGDLNIRVGCARAGAAMTLDAELFGILSKLLSTGVISTIIHAVLIMP